MKTLVCLEQPPLSIPNPSPWKPRRSTTLHPTPMKKSLIINHPTRTWKLHAKAKGFGGSPSTIPDKRIQRDIITTKNSGKNGDDDIPQVAYERMMVRILFCVGAPMATGIALLHLFGVVKDQHLWNVPFWLPVLTTFITFGASALGIAYGTSSTSWDAEKKGSCLGVEEAQQIGLRCGGKKMRARGDW